MTAVREIELSNGVKMPCDWCGEAADALTFNLVECRSVAEAVEALDDPKAAKYIIFHYGAREDRHVGPWALAALALNGWPTGGVLVTMQRAD